MRGHRLIAVLESGKSKFVGFNHLKTHPELIMSGRSEEEKFSNHHAECSALLLTQRKMKENFKRNVKKMKLFVMRVKRDGAVGLAKPCSNCYDKLLKAGISPKNIYYTDNNGKWQSYVNG